jgi:hypothetical protein
MLLVVVSARLQVRADDQNQAPAIRKAGEGSGARHTGSGSKKDNDADVTVLTPEGAPASKATVAIGAPGYQIRVINGEIASLTACMTDASGRFHWPWRSDDFSSVITHQSGFADLMCSIKSLPKTIRLTPWARVEGIYYVARKPESNVPIQNSSARVENREKEAVRIFLNRGKTDANGKFVFERVIPGQAIIGRQGPSYHKVHSRDDKSGSLSSAFFVAGKTTHMDFGASGRPVIGQLRRAPSSKPILPWNTAHVQVTSVGQGARQPFLLLDATVEDNGNFCISDVPVGRYMLSVGFGKSPRGEFSSYPVTVPEINDKLSQRPVDLGIVTLEPQGK